MSKRTLGGTNRKAIRTSGFRARMKTHSGKNVIKAHTQSLYILYEAELSCFIFALLS